MELDVTQMVDDSDEMFLLAGSRMEHGPDAGKITWANSVAYAAEYPLLSDDDMRDEARAYFKGFGAWSEEEIDAWPEEQLQAMMVQEVATNIRAVPNMERIYRGDDGRWYFYVGD